MKRSRRLQKVVDFTAEQEREVAEILARSNRQIDETLAQIEAMRRFRDEYCARLQHQDMTMNARQLNEYRAFLTQLGRAIEEQEANLQTMRQEHAALQRSWRQVHCRHRGVGKVQQKFARQEQKLLERRMQGELDDRSAARRRKNQRP